jgi:DNA adenine methylase
MLPRSIDRVQVPPIKTQGIKSKLVPFILANLAWEGKGRWIEPFMGSGVVLFNSGAKRMLGADSNRHIINLYRAIRDDEVNPESVRRFLRAEGEQLRTNGESHYYLIRQRFNETGDPLDFLFLNRSCFNGVMRFNKKGGFNVPFCRKPERFAQALVTKIANQVAALQRLLRSSREVEFAAQDWRATLASAGPDDFVYMDPPYVGRHTDYFNQWSETDAVDLAKAAAQLPCGFALSMWLENRFRRNDHIERDWHNVVMRTRSHFYHVGSTESLRNEMTEALVIRPGFEANPPLPLSAAVIEEDDPQLEELELFA